MIETPEDTGKIIDLGLTEGDWVVGPSGTRAVVARNEFGLMWNGQNLDAWGGEWGSGGFRVLFRKARIDEISLYRDNVARALWLINQDEVTFDEAVESGDKAQLDFIYESADAAIQVQAPEFDASEFKEALDVIRKKSQHP